MQSFLKVPGRHIVAEVLGWPLDELMHHPAGELAHPDDLGPALDRTMELLRGERSSFSMPVRYRTALGSWVSTRLSVSLAYDTDGKPLHLVSVVVPVEESERGSAYVAA